MIACLCSEYREFSFKEVRTLKVIANVLLAYGDESTDEKYQRVFAIAAVLGSEFDWDLVKSQWEPRTAGIPFHAKDCESNQGDYENIPHKLNRKLYIDLIDILIRSKLIGFGFAMPLQDFRDVFVKPVNNFEYYKCLHDLIASCANIAKLSIPSQTVKFTFDINRKTQYNAGQIYDGMVNDKTWEFSPYLHPEELSFACRKTVGIQVADLIARESMKHLDNQIGPTKRPSRVSYSKLASTTRFFFRDYHKSDLVKYKAMAEDLYRQDAEPYQQWLKEKGIVDSMASRLSYLNNTGRYQ